jgi:predicted HAD superfamily Cof-like phosphohydrolase
MIRTAPLSPSTNYELVQEFHQRFQVPVAQRPALLDDGTFMFRFRFLCEELAELEKAHNAGDVVGCLDALADLLYVAYGTADMMGLPLDEAFQIVHRANMKKERAASAAQSKRGSQLDVIKPVGWEAPEPRLKALLVAAGLEA